MTYDEIAKIFEEIELSLVSSLRRNLARHKAWEQAEGFEWSAWQAETLKNMERFRRENLRIVNHYSNVIDSETRSLMEEQFREGEELAQQQLDELVSAPEDGTKAETPISDENFFGVNKEKMDRLMNDITTLEKKAETAALRMTDDVYRQTLYKVQLAMGTGSMTLQQAIDSAVKDFLDKGINCIVYKDGRRVNISDYVRMALRTTSTRAKLQGQAKQLSQLGYDTVIISQYGKCSDTCLPWQGRVYIDDVFTPWQGEINGDSGKSNYCGKWFPLLSSAIRGGLFHPNCRHTMLQYIDGITKPPRMLDEEKIKESYRKEQQLRALERNVRKAKRKVQGSSDKDNIKKAKEELKKAQKAVKDFIEQTNQAEGKIILKRDYGREKVYEDETNGNFSSTGVANSVESGIIESERPMAFKNTDKAIEYAKNSLSVSADSLSELPVERVNEILNDVRKLYRDMPKLNGFVDEIILDDMNEIAKASLKWVNNQSQIRLKLSRSMFSTMSTVEMEKFINDSVENGFFSPKDGLFGVFKHEFAHMGEFLQTLQKYDYSQSSVLKSLDMFELSKSIKELALRNCGLDNSDMVIERYLGVYATHNPAEFIAEAYSSTDDNILVNEVKRLLKRKWGI